MCVFEEKLDDVILERLQDFEFAVSRCIFETITIKTMISLRQSLISSAHIRKMIICQCSSLTWMEIQKDSSIILPRHENWMPFLEIFITKF